MEAGHKEFRFNFMHFLYDFLSGNFQISLAIFAANHAIHLILRAYMGTF